VGVPGWTIVLWVLIAGAVLVLMRLGVRWFSLVRLRRKVTPIKGKGMKIYQLDGPVIPFSFGKAIYINRHLHSAREWEDIILHEYVHIRQRHTIDIMIAELVCVVNWYNPFAWLIRYSIRQNLEFIADQEVLDKGADPKGYQYHLLKVVGEPRYRLANNFNFSALRERIVMMNKMRTPRVHLFKLLFLLPLVAVLLLAFRDRQKLPDRVPQASGRSHRVKGDAAKARDGVRDTARDGLRDIAPAGLRDTVPDNGKSGGKPGGRMILNVHRDSLSAVSKDLGNQPVHIIGGREVPADTLSKINPDSIASVDVLKDSAAMNSPAFKKYGKRAQNGIVIIYLKGEKSPMCLVDGRETSWASAMRMDPGLIESVHVWKGAEAKKRYGDKGENGVVVIKLKAKGPQTGVKP
ncbi:MAG TPA: M56 family metallopeptidase, partial [Puia sp.]|nr:M56 family metallopeptidase [Puia sp.]